MAKDSVIKGKSLEELEREITCGICQEHYTEPKILPCLHYYCKQCVLRLANRAGLAKPFSCPECCSEVTLPEEGVEELKTAFFINRLTTTVSTMERVHGKVEVKCELCSDSKDKAEAFCRQCAMFICKNCVLQHNRWKTHLTHEVTSLEDLKQGRAKAVVVKEPPTKLCSDHEEPLAIYCFDCENLICRDCTVKDHRDHNFEFCKKAASKVNQEFLVKLGSLKDQGALLSQAIQKVQTVKQQLKADSHTMSSNIKTSFKKLRGILDEREQELLEEAAGRVQEKIEKLSAQEKNFSVVSAEIQSVVDYTEQCVRHCTDNEVMSMHTEIRRQIEQKIEEHSKSERNLEPEEEADIGVEVRCGEALQQLIQTQANVIQLPVDPAKCTLTMKDNTKHEVDKTSKATLVTRFNNNTISRRHHEVSCSLGSLYDSVRTQCKVAVTGAGQYSIQYTPTVRGRHELTVSVDGQQVAGSPFSVFVSIHPTKLGEPVKVWKDIVRPTGIAVTSTGDIIVAEDRGTIVKLHKEKTKTAVMDHKLKIRKLEVTSNHIYCINEGSNKILQCSLSGDSLRIHEVSHISEGQRGLAIVGDEVMVCSKDTSGTIMIYDKELKYVRCIKHEDKGYLWAISSDCYGNLYCADRNNCVQVFSTDGVFLRSFSCDEKGVKKVKWSWGLCVSGDYVYVCNGDFYNISVFTTDGVYVTSFGQRGSNEGEFNYPHSVCVDQDGFVYVTDTSNGRVQCF